MLLPWKHALRSCLQQVPDETDLDYAPGVMALEPLQRLFAAVTDEQRVALGWFALADVAVWPQVPSDQRDRFADATMANDELDVKGTAGAGEYAAVGGKSARALLDFAIASEKHAQDPNEPEPQVNVLRDAINDVARLNQDPDRYWTEWLSRVVPAAVRHGAADARRFAAAALRFTLTSVAPKWDFEAGLIEKDTPQGTEYRGSVAVVTPGRGGAELYDVGGISDYEPQGRVIRAKFEPLLPVDPYRMGYWLQTTFLAYFMNDAYSGRYDQVVCTNTRTAEVWVYDSP